MKTYESLEAYEAAVRRGEVAVKRERPAVFDWEAYLRKIDDERRAERRKKRLDLKWAGVAYAVALLQGAVLAFDGNLVFGAMLLGFMCASLGAACLDTGLRSLFGEDAR